MKEAGNFTDFQQFFSLSLDLFCVAGTDGYFKYLNHSWEILLGYTIEELKSRPFLEFVIPEDAVVTRQTSKESFEGHQINHFENRYRCKDGSYKWIQWVSRTLPEQNLVYAVARDVTDRKLAEEQLKVTKAMLFKAYEEERRAHVRAEEERKNVFQLLTQIPAVVAVLKGPNHVFEFANEAYRKCIGGRNPVGQSAHEIIRGLDEQISSALDRVYQTGERFSGREMKIPGDWHGTGKLIEKVFTFTLEPMKDNAGKVNGIWILALELTEAKKMEAQLRVSEKMASLGTLAAGVAHELNNPLSYAMMNVNHILEKHPELDADVVKMLKDTEDGLRRVTEIAKSLKRVSRSDDRFAPTDVHEAIGEAIKFAQNETRHRAKVILDLGDLPPVFANQNQLMQVFLNLIVNAAQAMKEGAASKNEIKISTETPKAGEVVVRISDTGSGIPPESIEKIFDPFFTTKPMGEGIGLGLSICHGIITSLKGDISVESKVGAGTTFEIRLPSCKAESIPAAAPASQPEKKLNERLNVLIVDDEKRLLEVLSEVLSQQYSVTTCLSGREAVQILKSRPEIDLILCDLMMPEMTGMELFAEVSGWNREMESKFIFTTGGTFTAEGSGFLARVKNLKLEKPFTAKVLRAAIEQWKEAESA